MRNRWAVLALVVLARTAMGLQFQSIAAVGPFLVADLGLSYAELGTLIGFYLLPGTVLALPAGFLGARFGDRAVVLAGLGLMALGSVGIALGGPWSVIAAGRLVSGAGGVLITSQMAKIVTDWFAGRELATALGIMLDAWPLGIALALTTLGGIAAATTWQTAVLVTAFSALLAFGLMLLFYRELPAVASPGDRGERRWWMMTGHETALVVAAGLAWATMNAGYILVLSFGPKLLLERGLAPTSANLVVSWASFLGLASVPLGGALLDRIRRRDTVIVLGMVGAAVASAGFALGDPAILWSVLVGLLIAPAAGVVALPGEVLPPRSRSTGFGLFYALYYACMGVVPAVAGALVDRGGGAAALWLAAMLWLAALPAFGAFRFLQRRWAPLSSA